MGKEIERKFLVVGDAYRTAASQLVRQGYLTRDKQRTVRIRTVGANAYLTIKGMTVGATRDEFEYPIPLADANQMLDCLCELPLIEKRRYVYAYQGKNWEVDEFQGENSGLVIAEVELTDEQEAIDKPPWVGREVTRQPQYLNANLVDHPYAEWPLRERSGVSEIEPAADPARKAEP
jgi:CYTH domain-containing protein